MKHPYQMSALSGAVLLAVGMSQAMAAPTTFNAVTFKMYDPTGALINTDTAVTGQFDIIAESATLTSTVPFFGLLWTAYNTNLYGPGTYTVNTNDAGCGYASCASGTPLTFTVPAGHVGAHMKFAWGTTGGIDVVNIWNSAGTSVDIDSNGTPGLGMVDGPFQNFSANFDTTPSPAANTAPAANDITIVVSPGAPVTWNPPVSDTVDTIDDGNTLTCTIASQPAGGVGVASINSDCSSASFDPETLLINAQDTFTYAVDDGHYFNNTSTGTVTVVVDPNWPAGADTSTTANGTIETPVDITSLITDADDNVDYSTLVVSTAPTHGNAVADATGFITYTADTGYTGTDSFQYSVSDADGKGPATGVVTVTVRASEPSVSTGTYTPGNLAASVGSIDGSGLTATDVGTDGDMDQQCVGGCFDFEVSGIAGSATVVLPLSAAIPAATPYHPENQTAYRKLVGATWRDFSTDDGSVVASAAAISTNPLVCPEAGSSSYAAGLTAGHRCLQLTIIDGGDNDADGNANGTVVDPGGIGVAASVTSNVADPDIGASGGGGALGWVTLAGLLACLRLSRRGSKL